jgi:hypothetical protein
MSAFFPESDRKGYHAQGNRSALATAGKSGIPLETRLSERVDCSESTVYEYYDPENFSRTDTFEMGEAKICNYSRGGMCLELSRPLTPHLPVYVKLNRSAAIPGLGSTYGYHVEVVWCRQPSSKKKKGFRVGVRFYESPMTASRKRPSRNIQRKMG